MKTLLLLSALLCGAFLLPLPAASPEDLRAGIEKLTREARAAREQGRNDDANALMAQGKKLQAELREREAAEGGGKDVAEFKARGARELEALERAGKDDQAEQLRRKLAQAKGPDRDRNDLPPGKGDGRAFHLMEAIKHLRAAGLNEPAEHLERMAGEMREGLDRGDRPGGDRLGGDRSAEQLQAVTREMHGALQELREQMGKMQQQLEELRAQTAKKAGAEKQ